MFFCDSSALLIFHCNFIHIQLAHKAVPNARHKKKLKAETQQEFLE